MDHPILLMLVFLTMFSIGSVAVAVAICYKVGDLEHKNSVLYKIMKREKNVTQCILSGFRKLQREFKKLDEKHLWAFVQLFLEFIDSEIEKGAEKVETDIVEKENKSTMTENDGSIEDEEAKKEK